MLLHIIHTVCIQRESLGGCGDTLLLMWSSITDMNHSHHKSQRPAWTNTHVRTRVSAGDTLASLQATTEWIAFPRGEVRALPLDRGLGFFLPPL